MRVFSGGPVQPEVGFVVHSADYRRPETVAVNDRLSMTSSRVPSQTASLFVLRDRLVGAENAVVDVMVVDRDCCLYSRMRPDADGGQVLLDRWLREILAERLFRGD